MGYARLRSCDPPPLHTHNAQQQLVSTRGLGIAVGGQANWFSNSMHPNCGLQPQGSHPATPSGLCQRLCCAPPLQVQHQLVRPRVLLPQLGCSSAEDQPGASRLWPPFPGLTLCHPSGLCHRLCSPSPLPPLPSPLSRFLVVRQQLVGFEVVLITVANCGEHLVVQSARCTPAVAF